MTYHFEQLRPEDARSFYSCQSWVYGGREFEGDLPRDSRGETHWAVKEAGRVVCCTDVIPYQFLVRGKSIPSGGVAAVGTLPEARRTGAASRMMEGVVKAQAELGYGLSCLYPYRETYYSRFGYATCGWRWQIHAPAPRIPQIKSDLLVRRLEAEEAPALLNPVYEKFIGGLSGSHLRDEASWHVRFGQKAPGIYAIGDPVEAYLWAKVEGFWGDVNVGEMAWSSGRGYRGLVALLASLTSNQNSATWIEPPDSPYLSHYLDQGVTATLHRPTMYRITDLRAAFADLRSEEPISFEVADPLIVANNGVFTLGPLGLAEGGDPSFRCGISALTQSLLGQPSLERLASTGQIEALNANDFERACKVLPAQQAVCMEFF